MLKPRPAILMELLGINSDDCLERLVTVLKRDGCRSLNQFGWRIDDYFPLSEGELSTLIVAFTHLENLSIDGDEPGGSFCGGSTSQVHRLLDELRLINLPLSREMEEWAFRTALNPYNPYGTYNRCRVLAKTAAEYHRLNSARFAAIRDDEALSGEGAKERIALRQRAHTVRITKQSSASALRNQHIEHLETLSPRQRLENLITHGDKSPNYYPARFADLDAATELDSVQRAALLKRLKFAQRGRWRALAKALFTMQH